MEGGTYNGTEWQEGPDWLPDGSYVGEGKGIEQDYSGEIGMMQWFSFNDLAYDLDYCVERFEQKYGRKATILWTRDGLRVPEGFGLAAKKDSRILPGELYLE